MLRRRLSEPRQPQCQPRQPQPPPPPQAVPRWLVVGALATWTISTALVWRHAAARQQPLLRARLGYDLLLWALLLSPVERALYGSAHPAYRRAT